MESNEYENYSGATKKRTQANIFGDFAQHGHLILILYMVWNVVEIGIVEILNIQVALVQHLE